MTTRKFQYSCLIFLSCFFNIAISKLFFNGGSTKDLSSSNIESRKSQRKSMLLPQLLPHEDNCYLLEFHTDNCDQCEQMEPVLQRLEDDLGTKIRRINVLRRREFLGLLECVGHDEFGGFPFYFNRRTAQAVGGATSYYNLKKWGTGHVKHIFQDPPENMHEVEPDYANRQSVGTKGLFLNKMLKPDKKSSSDKNKQIKDSKTASKTSAIEDVKGDKKTVMLEKVKSETKKLVALFKKK